MARLDHITNEELWELLDELDGSTETLRILVATAFKQGDSTSRLDERHDGSQRTIRNWLSRFKDRPLHEVPFDEDRAGRPYKLTDEEEEQLVAELRDSPQTVGFEQQAWVPRLVYHRLKSEYGVEYSLRHIRRLMREAWSSWWTARPQYHKGDPEQAAEFQEAVKKRTPLNRG